MSKIGQNIKKIRSAKKLNQTEFGKIFDLTRGTVGAYEEGRAEPKIDTIIQIANYFSISIDLLLNKELSVSELFSFDIVTQKLDAAHGLKQKPAKAYRKGGIGLVKISEYIEYIVNHTNKDFIANLPYVELPINFKGQTRAFEMNGSEMEYQQHGLHHGDLLLCSLADHTAHQQVEAQKPYCIVHKEGILIRRFSHFEQKEFVFTSDDPNYSDFQISSGDILELWLVKGVYSTYLEPPKMIEEKVMRLETQVRQLENALARIHEKLQ